MLSTLITIDNTEFTSLTATTPYALSSTSLAAGDKVTIDIVSVGTGGTGLKLFITGHQ